MAHTFSCDERIVITIPLAKGNDGRTPLLPPEKFHCVFKDTYKVFLKGQPKALGVAQIITGLLIISLGMLQLQHEPLTAIYTMPSVMFALSGFVSYAAGHAPNMNLTKMSFSLNIICFFGATAMLVLCCIWFPQAQHKIDRGVTAMAGIYLFLEMVLSALLIHWESKAICRSDFNTLPLINLKYT